MLSVKNLAGSIEGLTDITDFERVEELNGELSLSFSSYLSDRNAGYHLLQEESIITDGNQDYRIKNMKSYKDSKFVDALSIYFDNADVWQYAIYGGTHTFNEFMSFALTGTGWTYNNVDITGSMLIPNFGNANVLTLVETLLRVFKCERQIGAGKNITFKKEISVNNDAQYRYGHNIVALSKSVDTSKLKTYVKGFGANALEVSYTSPNAAVFGTRHAEPIYDDRYTVSANLIDRIKSELVDYPETTIELDAIELQDKALGEKVWLIYEPLNIEFQTRVLSKVTRIPKELSTVTIGTNLQRTLSDDLVSQKIDVSENQVQTRSSIEQTNEQISFKVDSVDYNGNTIASMINQTATTIDIIGSKLNLVGAVNVLSDIAGALGTITTGKIKTLQIEGTGKQIYFGSSAINFEGRIDYADTAMRFQRDEHSYVKVNAGGSDGHQAVGTSEAAIIQLYGAGVPIANFGIESTTLKHKTLQAGTIMLKFLNGSTEALQVRNAADGVYRPIHASEFTVGSLRETKKNIEPYTDDALNHVLTTFVHRYNMIDESDTELKRIGLIYDEVPADMASVSGAGVDIYSMGNILWRSQQQLNEKLEKHVQELTDRILFLEEKALQNK